MTTPYERTDDDAPKPRQIRINVPDRYYLLPGTAVVLGITIGLFRGSRAASLRFLAENVHRPPTTVQGWYFYNKTKNYRLIMGGLKEAGWDALKLGTAAAGWVCIEEGSRRLGEPVAGVGEILAGVGTAGVFSAVYRLPRRAAGRTMMLGLMIGSAVWGLRLGKEQLKAQASARRAEIEAAASEGGKEDVEYVGEAVEAVRKQV
ncbi:hypothetical protein PHLCEN_2v9398 [Hermanssonia centrifuga]|uniref:Uncharacterized protein n=1 Tax=Hermanssonia centrifuga TaxID=98765 RepID=A0A2R6NQY6_9APHY|nr:hypothetical protein PHLCEN_2v9398 [Hermanssonia centrifuga]